MRKKDRDGWHNVVANGSSRTLLFERGRIQQSIRLSIANKLRRLRHVDLLISIGETREPWFVRAVYMMEW